LIKDSVSSNYPGFNSSDSVLKQLSDGVQIWLIVITLPASMVLCGGLVL
jgi:hypothetical protein